MDRHHLIRIAAGGLSGEARERKILSLLQHPELIGKAIRKKLTRRKKRDRVVLPMTETPDISVEAWGGSRANYHRNV